MRSLTFAREADSLRVSIGFASGKFTESKPPTVTYLLGKQYEARKKREGKHIILPQKEAVKTETAEKIGMSRGTMLRAENVKTLIQVPAQALLHHQQQDQPTMIAFDDVDVERRLSFDISVNKGKTNCVKKSYESF